MKDEGKAIRLSGARIVQYEGITTGTLAIVDGRQASTEPRRTWSCDLRAHLIFPGLVNAHDHLHFNAFPSISSEGPFANSYAWIEAFQCHMDDPAIVAARAIPRPVRCWHGALKNLLCGATTVAHHDPYERVFDDPAFPTRMLRDSGWCHSLGMGLPGTDLCPLNYGPSVTESFAATSTTQPWIIHLAEGTDRIAGAELGTLDRLGCLAENTVLVHGVGLRDTDQERLIARGAGVVWCPGSNLAMLGRTLRPGRLLKANRLALGSDSRISGGNDLLSELRLAATYSDCAPADLLRLATEAGSRLLRMPDVGGVAPGKWADLLIVRDLGGDPYRALLSLRRADIRAVVRSGVPAIADPDFAGWFDACGILPARIVLDGKPKLCDPALLGPPGAAALEPGLELLGGTEVWNA